MIGPPPPCWYCVHVHGPKPGRPWKGWRCDAYPDGIPKSILQQGVDHFSPRPGDHGIQFSDGGRPELRKAAERRWREDAEIVRYFEERRRAEQQA